MDWMNWKTWIAVALALIALFAIYTFAAPETPRPTITASNDNAADADSSSNATSNDGSRRNTRKREVTVPGVDPVHSEWIDMQSGRYKTERDLFGYKEPPPPPPIIPKPPPPPPDADKDGIPDFRDNCPKKANPDQTDIDRNGIGDACQEGQIIPPPPPPPPKPVPPAFPYKYIGTFGNPASPIATFSGNGEIINARVGDVIAEKWILRGIGIESVDIGYVGFPQDVHDRIGLGQ